MNIYIDESIHEKYGFMLLAYVLCKKDPQDDLCRLLSKHDVHEFHSCQKMEQNQVMQELRKELVGYVNSNCKWGVLILPSDSRFTLLPDLIGLFQVMHDNGFEGPVGLYIDEGILDV